ncbi:hypothetical protein HPE56_05960 [Maribacter sp. ANRC-HE7]|uniref:PglD N-terminal domain-containing protein n=1 Tax=Maribacter aquimaris TaxID=2737171 RepID=A0ABR7UXM2_9FLAO|nr:DapH/DapD/GlmU-related protein [Maribacter aquimaris]MBD0777329.1 hypothetical protein [Maribacter aquimaris]
MKNIVIIGASEHHSVVLDDVEDKGVYDLIGYVDPFQKKGRKHNGYPILGSEHDLPFLIDKHNIYGGIVATKDANTKKFLVDRVLKIIPDFNFIASDLPSVELGRNHSVSNGRMFAQEDLEIQKGGEEAFIHPLADVQSECIGNETKVWQFSVILKNARVGSNCNINSHTFIENNVVVGNNVTVKCGVYLWDGMRIEDDVFIGPNVTFTNDKYPRSKNYPVEYQRIIIKKGASIGANSTILGGVCIGKNAMIGAGSVVSKNVPEGELWVGNPARFVREIESVEELSIVEGKFNKVEF